MRRGRGSGRHVVVVVVGWVLTGSIAGPARGDESAGPAAAGDAAALRFVVVSDRTGSIEPGAWDQQLARVKDLRPEVVLSVGDFIEGYSEDEGELRGQWEEVEGAIGALGVPFYYCPGNHDVSNEVMRALYKQRHRTPSGETWYSFDLQGFHFLILDPTTFDLAPQTRGAQRAFLEADLEAAGGSRHVFVFMHQPKWNGELWERLKARLQPARATIFSGHEHCAAYAQRDGFDWYILPPTATRTTGAAALGDFRALTLVTVAQGQRPVVEFVGEGATLAGEYLPMRVLEQREAALAGFEVKVSAAEGGGWSAKAVQRNPLDEELEVGLRWAHADAQEIETLTVGTGQKAARELGTVELEGRRATLVRRYEFAVPAGLSGVVQAPYGLPRLIRAQALGQWQVDGDTADWPSGGTGVREREDVRTDAFAWDGANDLSFEVRVGLDEQRLGLAVRVVDDMLEREPSGSPWHSDTVLFTWPKTGTGPVARAMIVIPPQGGEPQVKWFEPDGGVAGTRAMVKRTDDGYVLEMSLPREGLGITAGPAAGQGLRLDVAVRDRDAVIGLGPITQMWLSGGDGDFGPAGAAAIVVVEKGD